MAALFETTRRVEFRDTDAAGIVHFSVFFTYMEQTEHELLRKLGLGVMLEDEHGTISWPRVSAHCDYHEPVGFEDVLRISAWVERLGEKSVTYGFKFTSSDRLIATGKVTAVCCRIEHGRPPRSIPIPPSIADQLASFLPPPDATTA